MLMARIVFHDHTTKCEWRVAWRVILVLFSLSSRIIKSQNWRLIISLKNFIFFVICEILQESTYMTYGLPRDVIFQELSENK